MACKLQAHAPLISLGYCYKGDLLSDRSIWSCAWLPGQSMPFCVFTHLLFLSFTGTQHSHLLWLCSLQVLGSYLIQRFNIDKHLFQTTFVTKCCLLRSLPICLTVKSILDKTTLSYDAYNLYLAWYCNLNPASISLFSQRKFWFQTCEVQLCSHFISGGWLQKHDSVARKQPYNMWLEITVLIYFSSAGRLRTI